MAVAFAASGLGRSFWGYKSAVPGDFLKLWWTEAIGRDESGHSVVFLGFKKTECGDDGIEISSLIASMLWPHGSRHRKHHPQPCGFYGDIKRQCRCAPRQIETYRQRISGPLLDRIDIHCEVPLVDFRELSATAASGEKSETIRERVVLARGIQTERFRKSSNFTNSAMSPRQMKVHCQIDPESTGYLEHAMEEMNFSARAHDRILKVARTLADLAGAPNIRATDILEAIQYRSLDRKLFS